MLTSVDLKGGCLPLNFEATFPLFLGSQGRWARRLVTLLNIFPASLPPVMSEQSRLHLVKYVLFQLMMGNAINCLALYEL